MAIPINAAVKNKINCTVYTPCTVDLYCRVVYCRVYICT